MIINLLSSIIAAAYGNVADIEIVWTLIAAFGLAFSLFNIRESISDVQAVQLLSDSRGDRRYTVAVATVKAEIARAVVQCIFLSVGIYAMCLPSGHTIGLPLRYVIFSALFTWGFIIAALLISVNSYWNFRLRREMRNSAEEDTARKATGSL